MICSVPPSYVYQSPYLTATTPGSLVPLPATQLTHAAAVAAATTQFYEYQNAAAAAAAAAATYPTQYANGFEAYPYAGATGKGTFSVNLLPTDSATYGNKDVISVIPVIIS